MYDTRRCCNETKENGGLLTGIFFSLCILKLAWSRTCKAMTRKKQKTSSLTSKEVSGNPIMHEKPMEAI